MFKTRSGFTLVELLIVIVVIAILAAITIVAYNGVQDKANNTAVQSDMSSFAKKVALFRVENQRYPDPHQPGEMTSLDTHFSKGSYKTDRYNLYYCTNKDQSKYALLGQSKSGDSFYASSAGNKADGKAYPSWNTACEIIGYSVLDNISFRYGYHHNTDTWENWL